MVAEDGNQRPLGDEFSGSDVDPFDRVGDAVCKCRRRVLADTCFVHLSNRIGTAMSATGMRPASSARRLRTSRTGQQRIVDQQHGPPSPCAHRARACHWSVTAWATAASASMSAMPSAWARVYCAVALQSASPDRGLRLSYRGVRLLECGERARRFVADFAHLATAVRGSPGRSG